MDKVTSPSALALIMLKQALDQTVSELKSPLDAAKFEEKVNAALRTLLPSQKTIENELSISAAVSSRDRVLESKSAAKRTLADVQRIQKERSAPAVDLSGSARLVKFRNRGGPAPALNEISTDHQSLNEEQLWAQAHAHQQYTTATLLRIEESLSELAALRLAPAEVEPTDNVGRFMELEQELCAIFPGTHGRVSA